MKGLASHVVRLSFISVVIGITSKGVCKERCCDKLSFRKVLIQMDVMTGIDRKDQITAYMILLNINCMKTFYIC